MFLKQLQCFPFLIFYTYMIIFFFHKTKVKNLLFNNLLLIQCTVVLLFLIFITDGTEPHGPPKKHRLYLNVTEVGSERSSSTGGQYLQVIFVNLVLQYIKFKMNYID